MNPDILNQVPWSAEMPAGPQTGLIALCGLVLVAAIFYVYRECLRRRDLVPLYAMMGAGMIVVYEPLGDMLASVLYPIHGQVGWVELFGRKIPMFIGLLYFWYMSVPAIYFCKRVEQGITKSQLWRLYAYTVVLAIGIELYGVNVDAWVYYGPHPYMFFGVPLWCPLTYSGFLMVISMVLSAMATHLERRHHWLIILGVPIAMAGGHCAMALPAAAAMFSTENSLLIWLGGTISILLSLLSVFVASQIYCSDVKQHRPTLAAN